MIPLKSVGRWRSCIENKAKIREDSFRYIYSCCIFVWNPTSNCMKRHHLSTSSSLLDTFLSLQLLFILLFLRLLSPSSFSSSWSLLQGLFFQVNINRDYAFKTESASHSFSFLRLYVSSSHFVSHFPDSFLPKGKEKRDGDRSSKPSSTSSLFLFLSLSLSLPSFRSELLFPFPFE